MGLLIDASVLIEHERGRLDLDRHLEGRAEEDFFLSVVTASELLHGVHRARGTAQRNRRSACLARGLTLVTANVREFGRVEGLKIENWLD